MILKPGVRLHGLRPQMIMAMLVADSLWQASGCGETTITCAADGNHALQSKHYDGSAIDLRTHGLLNIGTKVALKDKLQASLGDDFQVLLENVGSDSEHIHVAWMPKKL